MSESNSIDRPKLDQEQLDPLRLETSHLSPKERLASSRLNIAADNPFTATVRIIELNSKAQKEPLTPQEEGERRGLIEYPGNPEGQKLLQKEYLASLGIVEMSDTDRERLRVIMAETHGKKTKIRNEIVTEHTQITEIHDHSIDDRPQETNGESSDVTLSMLYTKARLASLEHDWSGDPKAIIDEMIAVMPDDVTTYTLETISDMPKDEPSPLELYLLSKMRQRPQITEEKSEGSLRVMDSIACLRDQVRTKKFLIGIRDAIANLDTPGRTEITMCDAGTGALPILAIYAALSSDKVHCTALELNPNSVRYAREVVASLGLEDQITVVQADAIKFQPDKPLDLLVSETMHAGLTQEPLVQILGNLQPHVKKDGKTIPSGVHVQAALVPMEDFMQPQGLVKIGVNMHQVVEPEWQEIQNYAPGDNLNEINVVFPTVGYPQGDYMVAITNSVDVGSQHLDRFQSLITMPQYVRDPGGEPQLFTISNDTVRPDIAVQYKPGDSLNGVGHLTNK